MPISRESFTQEVYNLIPTALANCIEGLYDILEGNGYKLQRALTEIKNGRSR